MKIKIWNILLSIAAAFVLFLIFTVVRYSINNPTEEIVQNNEEGQVLGEQDSQLDQIIDDIVSNNNEANNNENNSENEENQESENLREVVIGVVGSLAQSEEETLEVSGEVQSKHSNTLTASTSANVKNILVSRGDRVVQGQVLIDLSGDAANQSLLIQKDNLTKQIGLQEAQIATLEQAVRTNFEISLEGIDNSLEDLEKNLALNKSNNQNKISSLKNNVYQIDEQISKAKGDMLLTDTVTENNRQSILMSISNNTVNTVEFTRLSLETLATPLIEILTEIDHNDYDDLEDDIRDSIRNLENWENNIDSNTIENNINAIINDIQDSIAVLNELIEETNDIDEDETLKSTANNFLSPLSQSISQMYQSISQIKSSLQELNNLDDSSKLNKASLEQQILNLEQQRSSLLREIIITEEQLQMQTTNLESQLSSNKNERKRIQENLNQINNQNYPEIEAQRLQLESLKLEQAQIDATLSNLIITAPFDGIISDTYVIEGQDVHPGNPLIDIITNDQEFVAFVHTSDIQSISIGQEARITLFGKDEIFFSTVKSIAPIANPQTRNIEVTLSPLNNNIFVPSSSLEVEFSINSNNNTGIFIPANSVIFEKDNAFVFVYDGLSGNVQKRKITVGNNIGSSVQVSAGVSVNESIVTEGQRFLEDGEKVSIK